MSDFPIGLFDRTDGEPPRWPTFGLKLSGPPPEQTPRTIGGPFGLALAVLVTMENVYEERSFANRPLAERTISIDTAEAIGKDFGIDCATQKALYLAGRRDAAAFLGTWQWERYLQRRQPMVADFGRSRMGDVVYRSYSLIA